MAEYLWETAEEIDQALAERVRMIRKRRLISQEKLSIMSGVSWGSIKRFESSGKISLISLTKIAIALGCTEEIRTLFAEVPYRDIGEVIHETK
ncbi:MAG: helix-turn-helix domain-containing protein [Lachnospiraceae bacterium]|nr:helix-turn-helix domain-containing protein [Lachnospiraceae bacterium]MDD3616672.1 helix-turn-helix domain-containing protein [Lachnospiraceae bacterium]